MLKAALTPSSNPDVHHRRNSSNRLCAWALSGYVLKSDAEQSLITADRRPSPMAENSLPSRVTSMFLGRIQREQAESQAPGTARLTRVERKSYSCLRSNSNKTVGNRFEY